MVKSVQILLACYNGAKWLPEQLESLCNQTDSAFTCLMQDDGSTDDTPLILQKIAKEDSRFSLGCESARHLGAIGNFWSLLKQSTADYIAFCDQDDVWSPDRIALCRTALEEAEKKYGKNSPLLVHSDSMVTDVNDNILFDSFFHHQGWDSRATTLSRLLVQNNVTGCTMMINRPLALKALEIGKVEDMEMHDWFLALVAAATGHILFIPQPLVRYRQHVTNVKGASQSGMIKRGLKALSLPQRSRERILLTYRQCERLLAANNAWPEESFKIMSRYAQTAHMCKLKRVIAVQKGGYTMQSPITRIGQMLFG